MLSSGIKFRAPIIPNKNSLKNVPTSSNLENSDVSNIEPNFPPLTYTQIINVIKNDMADAITLSEWLMLFCNDIYIDDELEKQEISILLWKCINNYDVVANMAFFLASQFIEKERKSYPVLLLDTLSIVKPFLHERHHRRVEWLTNIYKADYISCNKLALANNSQTLSFINKLKLAKPNATRKGLINNLIHSLPKTLDTISSEWLISSFSPLTRFELLSVTNELVQSDIHFSHILDTWLKENCLPSEDQSLWYELEPASRKALEEKYEISNYFLFELLVKLLSKDINSSALNINDTQSNQLRARSVFWKNYSQKFNQIKTTEFCTTQEWSEIEKKDFVAAFILGWYWEIKEADESDKIDKQSFNKLFNEVCGKKGLLIKNLENLIVKNNIKRFYYTGHDWIKLDIERKKIFIKGYNTGIKSNNDEKKRMVVKYNVLFSRLSDYYFYTNHRDETVDLSIKTIVDQIFGHLELE